MTCCWAARIRSTGSASRSSADGLSTAARNWAAMPAPASGSWALWAAPLWAIARWTSPSPWGEASTLQTLKAPADSPPTVTWSGSPPKAAGPQPVVDGDDDDVAADGERGAVVPGRRALAVEVGAAVDPHVDGSVAVVGGGGDDVEGEAVLVPVDGYPVGEALAGKLRGGLPEPPGVAGAVPGLGRCRRGEAAATDGRCRIGDAGEELDALPVPPPDGAGGGVRQWSGVAAHLATRSTSASPWPPPPQRPAAPSPPPRRRSSRARVRAMRVPDMPIG